MIFSPREDFLCFLIETVIGGWPVCREGFKFRFN